MANPFADDDDDVAGAYANPFADAAVTRALSDTGGAADATFGYTYAPPAAPTYDDKPWKQQQQQQAPGMSEAEQLAVARQKAEAMLREEEQERQRQALAAAQNPPPGNDQQQQQQPQQPTGALKVKNWPPCYPILYHSIKDEIPKADQRTVLALYYSWLLNVACYIVNMAGCMSVLIAGYSGKDFGYSIMYVVINIPLSFLLVYKPVYNAFSRDSSFYYTIFFFFGFWHILWMAYVVVGIQDSGSAGFINTIFIFGYESGSHKGEGAVLLVGLLLWAINLGTFAWLFFTVRRNYNMRGHTLQEARNQAFSSAAQNPAVQQAAVGVATTAATSYVQSQNAGLYQRQVDEV